MARWRRLYYDTIAGHIWRSHTGQDSACRLYATARFAWRRLPVLRRRIISRTVLTRVEDVKQFPVVERRRNSAVPSQQREAGELAIFQELGKALTSSLQLDQVLRTIMEKIDEFLRPDNWSLLLLDEANQELYFELAVGKASQALKDVRIKMGQGIAGWVAQHGETVVVPDTAKDTRFFSKVDEKTKTETQSIVAVPVKFRDTCLGVIELINCIGPEGFDPRDLKLLEALSDFAALPLENSRDDHQGRLHLTLQRAPHELHPGDGNLPLAALRLRIFNRFYRPRSFQT